MSSAENDPLMKLITEAEAQKITYRYIIQTLSWKAQHLRMPLSLECSEEDAIKAFEAYQDMEEFAVIRLIRRIGDTANFTEVRQWTRSFPNFPSDWNG